MGSQYNPNSLLNPEFSALAQPDVGPGAQANLQKRVNRALLVLRAAADEFGDLDHELSFDGVSEPLTGAELEGFRAGARLALQLLGEHFA
ncbi:hypothetical protein [Pseudomonas juntendi]|uniref:hypothetical protein n=1 Tax=Pseudomonas juntendi TaxID=2666183 RepID=UPI001F16D1B4|nr:hypothetical protein [Pseudomonas juntendi]MCO7058268.1 hypothetical protein [Pseudomonas juntendi]UJM15240.1 hypothetical protein L1P09_25845 [Pseudomonas juntendi]